MNPTASPKLQIDLVYALPETQSIVALELPVGSTVADALVAWKKDLAADVVIEQHAVGIFGKQVLLSRLLQQGDRVEIYRELSMDPKQARRLRAAS